MEKIIYRITLDAHKNGIQRTLQGFETADNMARQIAVNLTSSGDTYDIPYDHVSALIYILTPNAKEPSINECVIDGNTILYDVLPIVEEGITEMQIKLIETSLDGAKSVIAAPRFAVEVTKSNMKDEHAEQTTSFTALENALAVVKNLYNARLIKLEIDDDYVFRAVYADGTVYENYSVAEAIKSVSAERSKSWAVGGTGIREGEEQDNAKYYSAESKSAALLASQSVDKMQEYVNEVKMHSIHTVFEVDFSTGHLVYRSQNYTFSVDEVTGQLVVTEINEQ